ncbi:hypothetical protein HJG60_007806 [Phyllostomus discolor]|uniref:Uncharacterized protein n=1 Tax=Phyllostomus discolor TaxID=89673 RepID=A0A834BI89_9CHIR|nr:hypothetical protein HJG60_007806 [Phyllostomus discolor]
MPRFPTLIQPHTIHSGLLPFSTATSSSGREKPGSHGLQFLCGTSLFNPGVRGVSGLLILMKNKTLTRIQCFCIVLFVFSPTIPVKTFFRVTWVSLFYYPLDGYILVISKHFHIWLHLWLYHCCPVREEEGLTHGGWIGCLMSHRQLDPWLELGAWGFAGPLYLLQSCRLLGGSGLQREPLCRLSGQSRRWGMAAQLVSSLARQSHQMLEGREEA